MTEAPITVEQALAVVAYIVLRHGDAYAPLLDRLESEMIEVRRKDDNRARAERILKSLSMEATRALVA